MSLVPWINFPINFYVWEGISSSPEEIEGRREEGGRWEEREEGGGQDRGGEGDRGGACSTPHLPQAIGPFPCPQASPDTCCGLNVCVPKNV